MPSSKLVALFAVLATSASAEYFSLTNFVATDIRVPSKSHHISFHLTNPDVVVQEGGNYGTNCTISWTGSKVPTCYAKCDSPEGDVKELFLARVVPKSYNYAGDFDISIQEYYHDYIHTNQTYKLDSRHSTTVKFVEGRNGVVCSRGGQSDVCTVQSGDAWNVTYATKYYVKQPKNVCK